jgi:hypothetical protein
MENRIDLAWERIPHEIKESGTRVYEYIYTHILFLNPIIIL